MQGYDGGDTRDWAYEEFGHAELGDVRRTARLVRMAAALAEQPGGKVLDVFRSNAEQQGAYDLLGNSRVTAEAMLGATEAATVRRCEQAPWVHVVVDGTSLRLTDRERQKDFGGVVASGSYWAGAAYTTVGSGVYTSQIIMSPDLAPSIGSWYGTQTYLFPNGLRP